MTKLRAKNTRVNILFQYIYAKHIPAPFLKIYILVILSSPVANNPQVFCAVQIFLLHIIILGWGVGKETTNFSINTKAEHEWHQVYLPNIDLTKAIFYIN